MSDKAENSPCQVELTEGQEYKWCSCGRTKSRPFCDGSHVGTGCEPVHFVAQKTETVLLCGCFESGDPPFCDGSHNIL